MKKYLLVGIVIIFGLYLFDIVKGFDFIYVHSSIYQKYRGIIVKTIPISKLKRYYNENTAFMVAKKLDKQYNNNELLTEEYLYQRELVSFFLPIGDKRDIYDLETLILKFEDCRLSDRKAGNTFGELAMYQIIETLKEERKALIQKNYARVAEIREQQRRLLDR